MSAQFSLGGDVDYAAGAPDTKAEDGRDVDTELAALAHAQLAARRGETLKLHLAGWTYTRIAEHNKVSVSTVSKDLKFALAAHQNIPPERGRAKHRAVLDIVLRSFLPGVINQDKDAAMVVLRALERDAKMNAYDDPVRVVADISMTDYTAEVSRLMTRLSEVDPTLLGELTRGRQSPRPIQAARIIDAEIAPAPDENGAPDSGSRELDSTQRAGTVQSVAGDGDRPRAGFDGDPVGDPTVGPSYVMPERPDDPGRDIGVDESVVSATSPEYDFDGWSNA